MNTFERYQELIEDGLNRIPLSGKPIELYEPIRYMIALGGKRMRPALALFACDLFDGKTEDVLEAALGLELFHNFTLVHDDIMDKAPLRRNKPTVHEKWDQSIAILSGDAMFVKAYQQICKVGAAHLAEVMDIFNETALFVCEGQQLDMNYEQVSGIRIKEYLKMIELKTAVLLAGSLKIGAVIGGAKAEDAKRLYEFGKHIGIAFQLQDDILDVYGDAGKFGKQTGGDIISNKKTFLLLKAMEVSERMPYKREELVQWINAPTFNPKDKVEAVTEIYNFLNIRSLAREEMETHYQKGLKFLEEIPAAAHKKLALKQMADSLMVREA
jgi:geranylgeranyl diphosphate synthase type II